MNSIQIRPVTPRRWCRACGLPSPANQPGCSHCQAPPSGVRNQSATFNTADMVQHNVLNIENVEVNHLLEAMEAYTPVEPPRESSLHRFFMFTCSIAMWIGIVTFSTVLIFFAVIVYLAFQKASGG